MNKEELQSILTDVFSGKPLMECLPVSGSLKKDWINFYKFFIGREVPLNIADDVRLEEKDSVLILPDIDPKFVFYRYYLLMDESASWWFPDNTLCEKIVEPAVEIFESEWDSRSKYLECLYPLSVPLIKGLFDVWHGICPKPIICTGSRVEGKYPLIIFSEDGLPQVLHSYPSSYFDLINGNGYVDYLKKDPQGLRLLKRGGEASSDNIPQGV